MAVVIRLTATGKKHSISYRIVATDRQNKRDGKIVENLGFYNPNVRVEDGFKINEDRYKYWLSQGAIASPAVLEIIEGRGVRPPKLKKKKPEPKVEQTTPAVKPAPQEETEQEPANKEIKDEEPNTTDSETAPVQTETEPEKSKEDPEKTIEEPKA